MKYHTPGFPRERIGSTSSAKGESAQGVWPPPALSRLPDGEIWKVQAFCFLEIEAGCMIDFIGWCASSQFSSGKVEISRLRYRGDGCFELHVGFTNYSWLGHCASYFVGLRVGFSEGRQNALRFVRPTVDKPRWEDVRFPFTPPASKRGPFNESH